MMTGAGLRILIAGSGRLGYSAIAPLLKSHHEVVGLVQNARSTPRWKRSLLPWQHRLGNAFPSPMREAVHHGLPIFWLDSMDEAELSPIRDLKPDVLITCGFSIILSEAVLHLPRIGCINVHTALLPKHRGATPCAYVVLEKDKESGVSIHVTEKGIDDGAIIAQQAFSVLPDQNSMDVYWSSCSLTETMIVDAVNEIAEHGFTRATPQVLSEGNYDTRFSDKQARIDWGHSAEAIERLIRAAYIYVPAFFEFREERVQVSGVTMSTRKHDVSPGTILSVTPQLEVATGEGTVIVHNAYTKSFGGTIWPRLSTRLKVGMMLD